MGLSVHIGESGDVFAPTTGLFANVLTLYAGAGDWWYP